MKGFPKSIVFLIGIWALSLLICAPNLNRPLSKHHEFCTAVVMRIYDIWELEGFLNHKGLPIMTYPGIENKWINNFASGSGEMYDSEGNFYYVSHPPLAYYLPYFTFKVLHIKPDVLAIQLWNSLLHLACGLLFYFLVKQISSERIALLSGIIYLLFETSMWFQSNVYMSDMLVHFFFLAVVFNYYLLLKNFSFGKLFSLSVLLMFMVYCSWLGYFTGFVIAAYSFRLKKHRLLSILTIIAALILPTLIYVYQYSQINGINALVNEWIQRGGERSGFKLLYIVGIIKNYILHYTPLLVLIAFFFRKIKEKIDYKLTFLFFAPIILLHLVLSDYSQHDFTVLYALYPLVYISALAVSQIQNRTKQFVSVFVMLSISIAQYYIFNLPGETNYKGDRYDFYMKKGEAIAEQSEKGIVLFLWQEKIEPQTSFYAQCNVKSVNSLQEAEDFLQKRQGLQGKILYFDGAQLIRSQKINL